MGGQEVDIGRRKGEPRAAGTGRYKGEKVKRARIVYIVCDGSTDSAVIKEVMVFVMYCDEGDIRSHFVSQEPVEKGSAVNITTAIKQACQTGESPDEP